MSAVDGHVNDLYRFGVDTGRAFQVQDDVLDLVGSSEQLGKQRGSDLLEGKRTVITMHAREQGVDVESLVPADPESVTEEDIDTAVRTLEEAGSIDYARRLASDLVEDGKDHLDALPDNEARDLLSDLADFLIEREY